MEPDGSTYLLPHPAHARVIMTCAGLFALVITPLELWRGVFPLNVTTPFFGFIMIGGMGVGASFLVGGLFVPAITLHFSPGQVRIDMRRPWGQTSRTVSVDDIEAFRVEDYQSSDGPDEWQAVIRLKDGPPIRSRPLSSRESAERLLAEFRRFLDLPTDGQPVP